MAPTALSTLSRRLLVALKPGDPRQSILPFIPRPLKWLFLVLLLINHRAFPLTWHFRLFWPAICFRVYQGIWRVLDSPKQHEARMTRLAPVGMNPFKGETVFKTRATIDACDFNIHLSNSSYAMTNDMARFHFIVANFPLLYRDGGWIALGATHYVFGREIPLNSPYEIRLSIGAWDNKWIYMVARYVTYPSRSKSNSKSKSKSKAITIQSPQPKSLNRASSELVLHSSSVTPSNSNAPSPCMSPSPMVPFGMPLPPDAVLHCTAISRLCCKIGRITIPPALALTASGFALSPSEFAEIQAWRFRGKGERIKALYAGGWRDVPEEERWWDHALSGEIEKKRVEGLRSLAAAASVPVFTSGEDTGNKI